MAVEVFVMIISRLNDLLISRDLTRQQLAELTDIELSVVSKLCDAATRSIPFDVLDRLCEALQCQPADIFTWQKR